MGLLQFLGLRRSASPQAPKEPRAAQRRSLLARYDSAQTTAENAKHWAGADGLSAVGANSREVRRILRNRSRYEVANNGYADGIAQTLANDAIGTGPRLQVRSETQEFNTTIEARWREWAKATDLDRKLWTMRLAKFEDGEAFALLVDNPSLASRVKLDVQLVEADQVTSPLLAIEDPTHIDGITFDVHGNPLSYDILKSHPGDPYASFASDDYQIVAAKNVLHYFRARRPGQRRGVPEITSAVMLFGQLRRYTLAVIAAAEVAADFSLVIESQGAASEEGAVAPEAMDTIELEKRMATVLPEGWKLGQAKPEQPTTTYGQFKREILTEIARPLNMPFNIAAGDSSSYNYASGRLDHQTYFKALEVERALIERTVLEPLFRAWFDEAQRLTGTLPQPLRAVDVKFEIEWLWDGREHVDPAKEAAAQETRLRNHTTTLARELGRQGLDWEAELKQRARESALMQKLGLTPPPASPNSQPSETEQDEEEPARR